MKRSDLEDCLQFIRSETHVLQAFPDLIWQQAANRAAGSVAARAAAWQAEGRWTERPWLRWLNPPRESSRCVMSLASGRTFEAVAVTPDGRRVLTGHGDMTVTIWDAEAGQELATLKGHQSTVLAIALTPDGAHAVSGGRDKTAILWDLDSGHAVRTFAGHDDAVRAVAVTPDGRRIACGEGSEFFSDIVGRVCVWDIETGEPIHALSARGAGAVNALVVTHDGRWIVSGHGSGVIKVWDAATGEDLHTLEAATPTVRGGPVWKLALASDGCRLLSAGHDGSVRVWDLQTLREIQTLRHFAEPRFGQVYAVAVTADMRYAVSAGGSGPGLLNEGNASVLKVWDLASGRELQTLADHTLAVMDLQPMPDPRAIVSASKDGTARIWQLREGSVQATRWHEDDVKSVAISPDGRRVVSVSSESVRVWDAATGVEISTCEKRFFRAAAFTFDGRCMVASSSPTALKILNAENGALLGQLDGVDPDGDLIEAIEALPDGKHLATIAGGAVMVWNLSTGAKVNEWDTGDPASAHIAALPDCRHIVASRMRRGRVDFVVCDISTGQMRSLPPSHRDHITDMAVGPGSEILVTASADNTIKFWDLRNDRELATTTGHGYHAAAAFTTDGQYLITGGADRIVCVRRARTGDVVGRFIAPARVSAICARERRVVVGDDAGRIYLFELHASDVEPIVQDTPRSYDVDDPSGGLRAARDDAAPRARPWWRFWSV